MSWSGTAGRTDEVAAVRQAVQAVARGARGLVVVKGEPGIGKTRLLGGLSAYAADRGFTVLRGRSTELESDVPFAAVLEALGDPLPGTSGTDGHAPMTSAARWRLYGAVVDHLDSLAQRAPVALVLDDLHWADPATLELLEHTLRRPPRRAHLLAVGTRSDRSADRLLEAQRGSGVGTVVDLRPLSRDEAAPLLTGLTTPDARDRVFAASGGNPMLIEELVRAGASSEVPDGVSALVRAGLDRVSAPARALVRAGALLGDPFDLGLALATAHLDRAAGVAAVDELVDAALLRPGTGPSQLAFRHPVVRTAVHQSLSPSDRLTGHDRAARALTLAGAPLPTVARHLALVAGPGDEEAARVLRTAALQVRSQAPGIAADWLEAAGRAGTATPDDHVMLAETLADAGRFAEALAVVDDPHRGTRTAATPTGLRLVLAGASAERLLGRHHAARRRLTRAVSETDLHRTSAARLLADLALLAYESGDLAEMARWADLSISTEGAHPLVRGAASAMAAVSRAFAGHGTEATAHVATAVDAVERATDPELAGHSELLVAVPWSLIALERLPDALVTGERTAHAARAGGNGSAAVALDLAVVLSLGLLGRTSDCVQAADLAEQAARVTGNDQAVQWALWMRSWSLLDHGDPTHALATVDESLDLAGRLDDSSHVTVARAVRGAVLVALGDAAAGRPLLAAYDIDPGWVCRWSPWLVQADVQLGDVPSARTHADHALAVAEQIGLAGPWAAAARAGAMTTLAEGDAAGALALAEAAVARADSVGAGLEAARSALLAGRAASGRDRDTAVAHLTDAAGRADACGARGVHAEAVRELRRLGRRIGRGGGRSAPGASGVDSLSAREREVAHLVAQGFTNRDIAERLYLSAKTVESHLARAFAKLDVRTRAALVARLAEPGPGRTP